ncbi:uncharacterized protein LOC105190067 [Harpegnathos saltator]|uniref:uncharacterized protein LOC105190067 n=1 Tax=Harpegnathos saltator TaxID=610380 RepID=UPI000DBEE23E|nr:uncharacterized protein LOC105190067 [Harpegnathos saltator]
MAIKTISMKDLQALQTAGKIDFKNIDKNSINCNNVQQKADSINLSQENSYINGQQIQRRPDATILQQELQECKFIWTKQATFALLSAYEARNIEMDNTKKNKRFWQSIATDLNEFSLSNTPLTGDQVRWKFSALKKSYNKKKDHNCRSGNAPKMFDEFEKRLMDILGDIHGNINKENCFNSPILEYSVSNQSETQNISEIVSNELENVSMEEEKSSNEKYTERKTVRKKRPHGTGSQIARSKVELEHQWLQHLQLMQQKYEDRKNFDEMESKRKTEELELKREKIHLKKKIMLFEEQRLRQKIELHREKMSIEKEKCDILRNIIQSRSSIF